MLISMSLVNEQHSTDETKCTNVTVVLVVGKIQVSLILHREEQILGNTILTMALRLNPWRDGYIETRKQLEIKSVAGAKTVYVVFQEEEFVEYLDEGDAIALFEAVGSCLPFLESVIITLHVYSTLPSISVPPIQAVTSLMVAQNSHKVKYLTLMNLQLEGDDLDMNGMIEAIRIHPSLHSVVVKNCKFSSNRHINLLRKTLLSRGGMKHCDLLGNHAVVIQRSRSLLRPILYILCISFLVVAVLLGLANSHGLGDFPNIQRVFDLLPPGIISKHDTSIQTERQKRKRPRWRRKQTPS